MTLKMTGFGRVALMQDLIVPRLGRRSNAHKSSAIIQISPPPSIALSLEGSKELSQRRPYATSDLNVLAILCCGNVPICEFSSFT